MLEKIYEVYEQALKIPFDDTSKFVMLSDCHRGDGSHADNFVENLNIYAVAMQQYYRQNFTYIELGDGDELWANKDFSLVTKINGQIFELLNQFYQEDRLYLIYGNHDIVKRYPKWTEKNLAQYKIEYNDILMPLFPKIVVHEGIVLVHSITGREILLLHGHQVDCINSNLWKLSRFLVRYAWRPLEIIGIQDPTSPVNSPKRKMTIEDYFVEYSTRENQMVIAGHTHRTVFPDIGQHLYFNDGCCVYPHYITAIEIEDGHISLIKWCIQTKDNGTLFVGKELLKGPVKLDAFFNLANYHDPINMGYV